MEEEEEKKKKKKKKKNYFACWVPKATDTLRICNTYCFSTAATVTRTRATVLRYFYICSSCLMFVSNCAIMFRSVCGVIRDICAGQQVGANRLVLQMLTK